jgi:O-antigen/teichoic acid export membrane protein
VIEQARTTAYVAGGQVTMNVAAYIFSLIAARILIPAEFGAVTALLSILQMGVVASLGLQAAAARRIAVAPAPADRDATIGIVLRSTTLVSLMVGGAVAVASPVIVWILHLDSLWPALLCSLALVPLTAMGGFIGIAQGAERWQAVTVIALANGFGRLLAGVVALLIHPSVVSALIGIAIGAWAPVLAGARILRPRAVSHRSPSTPDEPAPSRRPLLREALAGTHTLFAFYVLSNLDALVARNRLDAHEAGLYAAGLILSKAALMAPSFVGVLLYPRLATDETAASLRLAVSVVAGVGLVATVATALLPKLALVLAGGGQYAEVAPNLWLFTLAGSVWSIVQVLVLDSLARRRSGVAILTWFAVVTLPVLAVITSVGVTGLILLVGMVGAALSLVLSFAPRDRG